MGGKAPNRKETKAHEHLSDPEKTFHWPPNFDQLIIVSEVEDRERTRKKECQNIIREEDDKVVDTQRNKGHEGAKTAGHYFTTSHRSR